MQVFMDDSYMMYNSFNFFRRYTLLTCTSLIFGLLKIKFDFAFIVLHYMLSEQVFIINVIGAKYTGMIMITVYVHWGECIVGTGNLLSNVWASLRRFGMHFFITCSVLDVSGNNKRIK